MIGTIDNLKAGTRVKCIYNGSSMGRHFFGQTGTIQTDVRTTTYIQIQWDDGAFNFGSLFSKPSSFEVLPDHNFPKIPSLEETYHGGIQV
jgi:hypothetical protein